MTFWSFMGCVLSPILVLPIDFFCRVLSCIVIIVVPYYFLAGSFRSRRREKGLGTNPRGMRFPSTTSAVRKTVHVHGQGHFFPSCQWVGLSNLPPSEVKLVIICHPRGTIVERGYTTSINNDGAIQAACSLHPHLGAR